MKICPKCKIEHDKKGTYCSRKCANSRSWTEEDKKKKSEANKKFLESNPHPSKGKPGWTHSDEMKELKRQLSLKEWDARGRRSPEEKAIQNRLNVHNYRARKMKATCPTADLKLIRRIMEACPDGYDVDHIVSMSNGGPHHQDNLQYLPVSENCRKCADREYDKSKAIDWRSIVKLE